jgi:hypothetical protein
MSMCGREKGRQEREEEKGMVGGSFMNSEEMLILRREMGYVPDFKIFSSGEYLCVLSLSVEEGLRQGRDHLTAWDPRRNESA